MKKKKFEWTEPCGSGSHSRVREFFKMVVARFKNPSISELKRSQKSDVKRKQLETSKENTFDVN